MKVILLAAGFGTRLRPITNEIPKCLVPIKGKPLLQIWLENLTKAGLNSFLINTHYLHLEVKKFVTNSEFNNFCRLVYEEELLGTAGTIIRNLDFADNEDLLVIHADNYCLQDMKIFINSHKSRPKECLMTMMSFECDVPKNYGILKVNNENVLTGFYEKREGIDEGNIANGAIYILSPEFQKILRKDYLECIDFSLDIIPNFLSKIFVYHSNDLMVDIGTVDNYFKYK
jgi:mannose-1-phosphate guanylyltransferase